MVKLSPGNVDPHAPHFARGVYYTRVTKYGIIAQKWPTKGYQAKTPYDYYRNAEFAIAARWAASPISTEYENAVALSHGSTNTWRDLLTSASFGSLIIIEMEDGTTLQQQRNMTNNPQYMLDLVTDVVGSMLYRSSEGWIGIPPGNNGDVLTENNGEPIWLAGYNLPNPTYASDLLDQLGATEGDLLVRGTDGWIVIGSTDDGSVLTLSGGVPVWVSPATPAPLLVPNPFSGLLSMTSSATIAVNRVHGTNAFVSAGSIINGVKLFVTTAAATPTITPCLYDEVGRVPTNLLRTGSLVTGVTSGINTFPFSSPYTMPADGILFPALQTKVATIAQGTSNSVIWGWLVSASGAIPNPCTAITANFSDPNPHVWLY